MIFNSSPFTVSRTFRFEAAHYLPNVPQEHKCRRMHGHSYRIDVAVSARELDEYGFVVDFAEIDIVMAPLIAQLDHQVLNDFIENPTAEVICLYVRDCLLGWFERSTRLEYLCVRVYETERAYAEMSIARLDSIP
jgi:6-pyruvoyltetrahydropterin/6-carboxytetrahydropterin synthase